MPDTSKKVISLILLFLGIHVSGITQTIENVDFHTQENTLVIRYDLKECAENETYDVKLLIRVVNDGYTLEPRKLTGDVKKVSCGTGKSISWIPLEDISELIGPIQAEVKITTYHMTPKSAEPEKKSKHKQI